MKEDFILSVIGLMITSTASVISAQSDNAKKHEHNFLNC